MKNYHKTNLRWFLGALASAFVSNCFAVVLQFFKGSVLDEAVAGHAASAVQAAGILFGLILCESLAFLCYRLLRARYSVGCTRLLKQDIFDSILRRDYVEYKQYQQGAYISRYTNEADAIRENRFELLPLFWEIFSQIVLVSGALFVLDWRIALVTLGLLTTPLYIPKLIEKRLQRAQTEYLKALESSLSKASDWLSGFEIIKNYSIERRICSMFETANNASMEKLYRNKQVHSVAQLLSTLISYLSYFIVLCCSAWLVLEGEFSAGDFFVAIGMINQLSFPLVSLADVIRQLIAVRPACKGMEEFISAGNCAEEQHGINGFENEIRFQNVTFAYEGRPPVLRDFNLSIRKGGRYLLQGPSGCGKTTAVNLLLKYFRVNSGSITIDGKDLEEAGSPYGCMTVVRQEPVLFHDTLRNNLTMYRDIPDQELVKVLTELGLERFAETCALDMLITEDGANLSGGEKKRICLGRALLRNTEIVIFDEPLANLDQATVSRVENLLLSIPDKTVLIVSHQFSPEKLGAFHQVVDFSRA